MSDYPKIECTCIDAYKSRKMRDPNCCACSCDYNDVVEENNQLKQRIEQLEREREEQKAALEIVAAKLNLKGSDCNFVHWIDEILAQRDIEQQIKALEDTLNNYVTKKFYPTNYAIQAHNAGVKHLYLHVTETIKQLRKGVTNEQ